MKEKVVRCNLLLKTIFSFFFLPQTKLFERQKGEDNKNENRCFLFKFTD